MQSGICTRLNSNLDFERETDFLAAPYPTRSEPRALMLVTGSIELATPEP